MNTFDNAKLKELRKNENLTQQEFARTIDVARTTYADYERGRIQPSLAVIQRICRKYNMQMSDFMNVENNTGVDLGKVHFKRKLTDEEKIVIIEQYQRKKRSYDALTSAGDTIYNSDIEPEDKSILLNFISYIRNKYELDQRDLDVEKRIGKGTKKND